jgi:hypothetical protein
MPWHYFKGPSESDERALNLRLDAIAASLDEPPAEHSSLCVDTGLSEIGLEKIGIPAPPQRQYDSGFEEEHSNRGRRTATLMAFAPWWSDPDVRMTEEWRRKNRSSNT